MRHNIVVATGHGDCELCSTANTDLYLVAPLMCPSLWVCTKCRYGENNGPETLETNNDRTRK